jgi:hypothetical protein
MSPTETIDVAQLKDAISTTIQEEGFWETPNNCIDATTNSDSKANAVQVCTALLSDDAALERLLVARKHDKVATISLFWEQVRFQARLSPQSIAPPICRRHCHRVPGGYVEEQSRVTYSRIINWHYGTPMPMEMIWNKPWPSIPNMYAI